MRHMFACGEALGMRLLGLHNVTFLMSIMHEARSALRAGTFEAWSAEWLLRYRAGKTAGAAE
jgi:queuine tRNA-ribosyltransferase